MSGISSVQIKDILSELEFSSSRSSGPGGQNVNKVNSKVTLKWDVRNSKLIGDDQKSVILHKLSSKMTNDDVILISVQEGRSQTQNKDESIAKLDALLRKAFTPVKKRTPTKPNKAAKRKRLKTKKQQSEKKQWRKKPD